MSIDETPRMRAPLGSTGAFAVVYAHAVEARDGPCPCWTFVTEAPAPALRFTLARADVDGETPPADGFRLLAALAALHGTRTPGEVLALALDPWLSRRDLAGVALMREDALPGVPDDRRAIAALALFGEEFPVAQAFGALRITARLGRDTGHFPHPPWTARDRAVVAFGEPVERSALAAARRVLVPDASVLLARDVVTLRLPRSAASALRSALAAGSADAAVAVLAPLDPRADACLVWSPGQSDAVAIASADSDGAFVGGGFVVLAPDVADGAGGCNVFEDGFAARAPFAAWPALRAALAAGAPFALPARADAPMGFALAWTAPD